MDVFQLIFDQGMCRAGLCLSTVDRIQSLQEVGHKNKMPCMTDLRCGKISV